MAIDSDTELAPSAPRQSPKRYIVTVAAATYFFWISLYLYVPILPLHAQGLGANLQMVGIVIASYAIGQILFRIPIGVGSDIIGRKPFAVLALVLSALGAIWLALSPDPWSLFAARTLTGVAAAGWVAISVLFASHYPAGNTTRAMAVIMSVNTLSLVTATFVGGLIAEYLGNNSTFYGAAGIGFAGALLLLTAPEPRIVSATRYSFSTLLGILKTPLLLRVSAIAITLQFVTFGVNFGFLPIHAENLGASKSEIGYITTAGLLAAVAGTAVSAWVSNRWGPTVAVIVAAVATLISLVIMTITTDLVTLGGLQTLNGFGRGMMNTVLISMALASAPVAVRATAMGSYQALYAIGMLLGPAASGPIAAAFGIEMVFWAAAAATVLGGAMAVVKPLPRK
jgi:predicted MFS family arabinose efflux permease